MPLGLAFEFDPHKANPQKHNVSFEEAITVFSDPLASPAPSPSFSRAEPPPALTASGSAEGLTVIKNLHKNSRRGLPLPNLLRPRNISL